MNHVFRVAVAVGLLPALSSAQTVTQSARALTPITVSVLTEIHGSTVVIPAGTPLLTGPLAATQLSPFGDGCLLDCTLAPTPTGQRYRLTLLSSNIMAQSINTVSGDTLLTLTTPPGTSTAVRLICAYWGASSSFFGQQLRGEVDVQADGSVEFAGTGAGTVTQTVPALVPPGGLPVRASIQAQTFGASGNHSLRLEVAVEEVLAAAVTTYEPGCGPFLDVHPTVQSQLAVSVQGLPTTGLDALLLGFARNHVVLPCGACTLGVRGFHTLLLTATPGGTSTVDLPVPPALLPITVDLQAAHLDLSPCAFATSNALEVLLSL